MKYGGLEGVHGPTSLKNTVLEEATLYPKQQCLGWGRKDPSMETLSSRFTGAKEQSRKRNVNKQWKGRRGVCGVGGGGGGGPGQDLVASRNVVRSVIFSAILSFHIVCTELHYVTA